MQINKKKTIQIGSKEIKSDSFVEIENLLPLLDIAQLECINNMLTYCITFTTFVLDIMKAFDGILHCIILKK